jgi:uncharacterized membrane protein YtjA (UPF0391 family)
MLYIGMLFFSLAIASGLYAFADIATAPVDVAQTLFYACLLLASVSFAVCLGRTQWTERRSSKASIAARTRTPDAIAAAVKSGAGYGAPGMAPAHTT